MLSYVPRRTVFKAVLLSQAFHLLFGKHEGGTAHAKWLENVLFYVILEFFARDHLYQSRQNVVAKAVIPTLAGLEGQRILGDVFHGLTGRKSPVSVRKTLLDVVGSCVVCESRSHLKKMMDANGIFCFLHTALCFDCHVFKFGHVVGELVLKGKQTFFP